jgi:hypothetical protein
LLLRFGERGQVLKHRRRYTHRVVIANSQLTFGKFERGRTGGGEAMPLAHKTW